jgi:hypothetical protein
MDPAQTYVDALSRALSTEKLTQGTTCTTPTSVAESTTLILPAQTPRLHAENEILLSRSHSGRQGCTGSLLTQESCTLLQPLTPKQGAVMRAYSLLKQGIQCTNSTPCFTPAGTHAHCSNA